jgi:phosphomannomutase
MQREHSLLAGEVSGHIFFKENYFGFDDAVFAACKLTYLMQDLKMLNFINNIPEKYTATEIKVPCTSQNKSFFIAALKNILKQHKIEFLAIDRIRCQNSLGWWIIRASNTKNIIFIRFGSTTYYNFNFIFIYLSHILQKIGIDFQNKTKLLNQNDKCNI